MEKKLKLTPAELEQLTLHELAEYLANIVLVLRRLPNVPLVDLANQSSEETIASRVRQRSKQEQVRKNLPDWISEQ